MLTKKFKSNKFYEVTRYFFKYGHDYDEIDGNTTVWDSLEKAKAFIEKYRFNRKFYSATVEEITVDREITVEDYKEHNYKCVSYQKVYSEDYDGNFEETPETIYYLNDEKRNNTEKEDVYKIFQVDEGTAWCIEAKTLTEAKEIAKKYKGNIVIKKGLKIVAEFNNIDDEKEYKICFGNDRTFGVQTVGLQSALELGQSYAKNHIGEKITVIDENKNTIQEFFEEKKEPVKSNIKAKTNLKSRYLTKKAWDSSHQDFTSWANAEDIVDEEIVQHFRDCVSPVAYDAMYLQCGEPYKHGANPKTGKWEPAFITFARELGSWVYKGICFYREYEDVG
ncbi:MAG: hypothetical protein ACLTXK_05400 [Megamonas funiformis]|uniref:hypothetical protein n=1 Tax=Megamonas funiformis TaxID=437897 RepID=UPI0039915EB2